MSAAPPPAETRLRELWARSTPGKWFVRELPKNPEKFFVQAPRISPEHPYDIEVLGEDDTLYPTRRADADFIVACHEGVPELLARLSKVEEQLAEARKGKPDDLRASGWSVAVHNDYRINGEPMTFWLFTKDGKAIKGEGPSDEAALEQVRHAARAETK